MLNFHHGNVPSVPTFPGLEEAIARRLDLACHVAICGVDNNPARVDDRQH